MTGYLRFRRIFRRAEACLEAGHPHAGAFWFEEARRARPRDFTAAAWAGAARLEADEPGEAARLLDEALALSPGHPFAGALRGLADFDAGRLDDAAARWREAAERAPRYGLPEKLLTLIPLARGEGASLDPCAFRGFLLNRWFGPRLLLLCERRIGAPDPCDLPGVFELLRDPPWLRSLRRRWRRLLLLPLAFAPRRREACLELWLAREHFENGEYKAALDRIGRAPQEGGEEGAPFRAEALLAAGRAREAAEAFDRLRGADGGGTNDPSLLYLEVLGAIALFGAARIAEARRRLALALLTPFLEFAPYYYLGRAEALLGNPGSARRAFAQAVSRMPEGFLLERAAKALGP